MVLRPHGGTNPKEDTMSTIIVGVDRSPEAHAAAVKAARMASLYDAPLHIVTAVQKVEVQHIKSGREEWHFDSLDIATQTLEKLAAEFRSTTKVSTAVVQSDPASALCDEATRLNASVIVVGNKRVQGVSRVLGSVAGGVTKSAPCDVFIVHTYE
jgi:nucleotide-binding universal stress UspA family protein